MGENASDPTYGRWYHWGRVVLYCEMGIATFVTIFSLYLAFTGQGGFLA